MSIWEKRRAPSHALPAALEDDAFRADAALGLTDWRALPAGATRWSFPAPSGRLAAISQGPADGVPVLLLPGVTGSKEDFLLMLPLLAERGFRVHAVDLAGQYESAGAGPARGRPYTWDLYVDDAIALLEHVGAAHVLGYSFAGQVAQLAALRRPDLVRTLALLCTPPATGNSFRRVKRFGVISRVATPAVGASLMIWGVRNNMNGVDAARLEFVRARFAYTRRASVDDVIGLMMDVPDIVQEVAALDVPKLVAVGLHDLWSVQDHGDYAQRIGATLAVYHTGHAPCETTPHQLVRDLAALYASASPAT